jgi:hypothetical protein
MNINARSDSSVDAVCGEGDSTSGMRRVESFQISVKIPEERVDYGSFVSSPAG